MTFKLTVPVRRTAPSSAKLTIAPVDDILTEIQAEYDVDLDIVDIDLKMKEMWKAKIASVQGYRVQYDEAKARLDAYTGSVLGHIALQEKVEKLETKIDLVDIKSQRDEYLRRSSGFVDGYKPLNMSHRISVRGRRGGVSADTTTGSATAIDNVKQDQRLGIIKQYLEVVDAYIPVNITRKATLTNLCEECGENLDEYENEGACICGIEIPVVSNVNINKEAKSGGASYGSYEDLKNFTKAFVAFQGEQPNKDKILPLTIHSELDRYFESIGRNKGETVRAQRHLANGKKQGTSFHEMITALEKIGRPDQYTNAHLIIKNYWGWRLHDLSDIHDQIMEDYKRTQKVWESIKDRDSSPNVKIRLYLHLRARGVNVSKSDFKFPVTNVCMSYYNDKLRKVFEQCDLTYEELV